MRTRQVVNTLFCLLFLLHKCGKRLDRYFIGFYSVISGIYGRHSVIHSRYGFKVCFLEAFTNWDLLSYNNPYIRMWHISVSLTKHNVATPFLCTKGVQPFYDEVLHPLLWTYSWATRRKITISGKPYRLNYCVIFTVDYIHYLEIWPRAAGCRPMLYTV